MPMKRTLPQIGRPQYSPIGAECPCNAVSETITTPCSRRYWGSESFASSRNTSQCSGSARNANTSAASIAMRSIYAAACERKTRRTTGNRLRRVRLAGFLGRRLAAAELRPGDAAHGDRGADDLQPGEGLAQAEPRHDA